MSRPGANDPIADVQCNRNDREVNITTTLSQPQVRSELQKYLSELRADDPRPVWDAERESGIASGIDQVFHFFFDDNDFDETAVGVTLYGEAEVQLVQALKERGARQCARRCG